jgi:hypothetical protein
MPCRAAHRRALALAAVAGTVLTGCGGFTTDVRLVQDGRLQLEAPPKASRQRLPVTIRWRARDLGDRTFAVFVDRSPVAPGETLRKIAQDEHDDACLARPGCPDAGWLSNRGVYLTGADSLQLRVLPDTSDTGRGARDSHEITVVLMDGDRRDGESAWSRQFYVEREAR